MTLDLADLRRTIDARTLNRHGGIQQVRPRLTFLRVDERVQRTPAVFHAALCVLVQGSKHAHFGGQTYHYSTGNYLLSALSLIADSEIVEASPSAPMLGIVLDLDVAVLARLVVELDEGELPPEFPQYTQALVEHPIDQPLADALNRLATAALDDTDWRMLGEGLLRECYYYLLIGPAGGLLRQRVARAGNLERIAQAIDFIRRHLTSAIDVEQIAKAAGMSPSSLHAQFKTITSYSPMQFVKRLRLTSARAALLTGKSVTEAAFTSGYVSSSQFSRDFRRQFGMPPSKLTPTS